MYHMGVVLALMEGGALPSIVSGTSGGAIVAGVLAIHTDEEMRNDIIKPDIAVCAPAPSCTPSSVFSALFPPRLSLPPPPLPFHRRRFASDQPSRPLRLTSPPLRRSATCRIGGSPPFRSSSTTT